MDKIIINGGRRLSGEVKLSGSKNSALPIISASLIAPGKYNLTNIPNLRDINSILLLLKETGANCSFSDNKVSVDTTNCKNFEAPYDIVRKMRASVLIMGAGLARTGTAKVSLPGGCAIGLRPIDIHLKGFEALGSEIEMENGYIILKAKKLTGNKIFLDFPSVGATENLMIAAVMAKGTTVLENAAKEPEIVDLANFLNKMGAKIYNAGTDNITICGVDSLKSVDYEVIPDRIEAGTYIIAALITGGKISINNFNPSFLEAFLDKLYEAGFKIETGDDFITAEYDGRICSVNIKTMPYPGFPTDLQAQFMALMTIAGGTSIIGENVFENRFMHVAELCRMNADIRIDGHIAVVKGVKNLLGAPVMATDLRASAALILAGLIAKGQTEIKRIYHLDRGYENLEKKLQLLNADIMRV